MSIVLDGTTGLSSPGLYAPSAFSGTYSDGIVVDYVTGNGRVTVGSADGIIFYNGGTSARTQIASLDVGGYLNVPNTFGFKNRIINGAMAVNQRGGTTTQNTTSNVYGLDQWAGYGQLTDGVFTMAQSSSTPPAGFPYFLRSTVTTADASVGSSQTYGLRYAIEGNNIADLGWGAAGASTITMSFWVRSSVTGTFGGSIFNGGNTRGYVFSFAINAANTWEQKTITIAGDTTGTWATDNTAGIKIVFSFGAGSTYTGAAGSWGSTVYFGVTGGVNLISTLNATFDITGVQLEKGSTATSFDYRPYGTELQLCQRYYWQMSSTAASEMFFQGYMYGTTQFEGLITFPTPMRTAPTITSSAASAFSLRLSGIALTNLLGYNAGRNAPYTEILLYTTNSATASAGYAQSVVSNSTSLTFIGFSSEL